MKVTKDDLKGKIADFPIEVVQRMVECQEEQGNKADVNVFVANRIASFSDGGFTWRQASEGHKFWEEVIWDKNFDTFFERYPKQDNNMKEKTINITKEDLKGEIKDFPIEVVQRMVDCQVEQGNKADVKVFANTLHADSKKGGFTWSLTSEGQNFWEEIIYNRHFGIFFKRYPKQENKKSTQSMKRTIEIDIDTAREWYKSENEVLKNLALQTFDEKELKEVTFKEILAKSKNNPQANISVPNEHLKKFQALSKLSIIADYLNDGWKPDWENKGEDKWYVLRRFSKVTVDKSIIENYGLIYFKTKDLAGMAIKLMGNDIYDLFDKD